MKQPDAFRDFIETLELDDLPEERRRPPVSRWVALVIVLQALVIAARIVWANVKLTARTIRDWEKGMGAAARKEHGF